MGIQHVYKFKNKYSIKICLFEISENKVVRAHVPKTKINRKTATPVINLFYFDNHYVLSKDLSRLLRTQITKNPSKIYLCTYCGRHFTEELKHKNILKKDNC